MGQRYLACHCLLLKTPQSRSFGPSCVTWAVLESHIFGFDYLFICAVNRPGPVLVVARLLAEVVGQQGGTQEAAPRVRVGVPSMDATTSLRWGGEP